MKRTTVYILGLLGVAAGLLMVPASPALAQGGVELGVLNCKTVPGTRVNLIIRSTVDVACTFEYTGGQERYTGETGVGLGIDLNVGRNENIAFTVISASSDTRPGGYALAGKYFGAKASATAGVGLGAAVLVGGGEKAITLQPLAVEVSTGLGVAGGLGYLYLQPAPK